MESEHKSLIKGTESDFAFKYGDKEPGSIFMTLKEYNELSNGDGQTVPIKSHLLSY
jgi:hypothetical protein